MSGDFVFLRDTGATQVWNNSQWNNVGSGSSGAAWGQITGTLSNQTDLQNALDGKQASGTYSGTGSCTNQVVTAIGTGSPTCTTITSAYTSGTFTPSSHTHAADDVTSGSLSDARVDGSLEADELVLAGDVDGTANANDLDEAAVESELESVLDLADLQGNLPVTKLNSGTGASASTYWRGDGTWATPSGGGGSSQMVMPLIADGAGITWTNMPAAVTFFGGSHRYATKIDLTNYTDVRLVVNKQGTAGAAASVVRLRYRTSFSTTVTDYSAIGTSEVQVAVNTTNNVLVSSWIALAAGAKADVFLALDGSGGDGALDPVFGSIVAQFR